jgi:cyanophycinase-like exopeptidase
MSRREVQSLYLLADSQLLFWRGPSGPFLESILKTADILAPRIAYIGASNGDSEDAHSIFAAAAAQVEGASAHHVRASYSAEDRQFLETANVVVLAGGDVEVGWNTFTRTGMHDQIRDLYLDRGAVIIGISAGAVQCGTHAALSAESGASKLVGTFGFVPYIIDVHDEKQHWERLSSTIHLLEGGRSGVGIPSGGGLAAHADGSLEPIRNSVDFFIFNEGQLQHAVAMPLVQVS